MVHIFPVVLSIFMIYLSKPGSSLFSWHPTLMTIGFGVCMYEAILLFSKSSSLLQGSDRKTKAKYHWILQVSATICIILGFAAIVVNKYRFDKPHFVSWHAIIGLVATIMVVCQAIPSVSLIYTNIPFFNPMSVTLATRKKLHSLFGALVFLIGYIAIFFSLYTNFILKNVNSTIWYLLLTLVAIVPSVVINQVASVYIFTEK